MHLSSLRIFYPRADLFLIFGLLFLLSFSEGSLAQSDADQLRSRQALESLAIEDVNAQCAEPELFACWELAMRLKDGVRGAPPQPERAFEYLLQVCQAGGGLACLDAVRMMQSQQASMERGYGGMVDILSVGCDTGSGEACVNYADAMFNALVRGGIRSEELDNAIDVMVDKLHSACFNARSPHAAACLRLTQFTQENARVPNEVSSKIRQSVSRHGTNQSFLEHGCSDRFSFETGLEAACSGLVQNCERQGRPEACASTINYVQMRKCQAGETYICNQKCLLEGMPEACAIGYEQRSEACLNTDTQGVGELTWDFDRQPVTEEEKRLANEQRNLRKDKDRCIEAVRLSPKVCLVGDDSACKDFIKGQRDACAEGNALACDTEAFLNLAFAPTSSAKWQGAAKIASRCESDPYLCEALGRFWLFGKNTWTEHDNKDKAQGLISASKTVLEMGCDAGSAKACGNRAQIAERMSEPDEVFLSFSSKACFQVDKKGDLDTCSALYHALVDSTLKAVPSARPELIDEAYRTYEQICTLDDRHSICRRMDDYSLVPEHIAWLIQTTYCGGGKDYDGTVVELAAGYLREDQCMAEIRRGSGNAQGSALYKKYTDLASKFPSSARSR